MRDVAGILELRGAEIDVVYIDHRVGELGLQDLWKRVRATSTP
jgi:hypothetical protein